MTENQHPPTEEKMCKETKSKAESIEGTCVLSLLRDGKQ